MLHTISVQNWKKRWGKLPMEDCHKVKYPTFIVADGVTRDATLKLPTSFIGNVFASLQYPDPSPSAYVAKVFCESFPAYLTFLGEPDEKGIRAAFQAANAEIGRFNHYQDHGTDFLLNAPAACVAAIAHVKGPEALYGFIGDCGIAIIKSDGDIRFQTESEVPDNDTVFQDPELKGLKWEDPEAREYIRETYINNPDQKNSYGNLNGDHRAKHFVRTGIEPLNRGDFLLVYTDGLEHAVHDGHFIDALRKEDTESLDEICQKLVKSEGTMLIY